MTTRIKGFWVALEKDTREDDAQPLLDAVKQMRGVAGVSVVESDGTNDYFARQQVRRGLRDLIIEFYEKLDKAD